MSTSSVEPLQAWRRKACVACTKAKRQCNKQTPTCRRCRAKGIECQYPLVRQICTSLETSSNTWNGNEESSILRLSPNMLLPYPDLIDPFDFGAGMPQGQDEHHILQPSSADLTTIDPTTESDWFLAEASWRVGHLVPEEPVNMDNSDFQRFVDEVQTWLRQWISDGHNPFIHRQLYRQRTPRSIQNAYSTLTAYLAKNQNNETMTFKIIEDSAAQLLREESTEGQTSKDTLDQLARAQALLVYQAIRLFDGNISARSQGELAIPVLSQWVKKLWNSAQLDLGMKDAGNTAIVLRALGADDPGLTWRMWIVAESVRRTWLTANILMEVYLVMRNGWSDCPGSVWFTPRKGIWDAPSAYAWSKECGGDGTPLFMQSMSIDSLLTSAKAYDVDSFSHAIMVVSFGGEKLDRWIDESKEREPGNALDTLFLVDF